MALSEKQVDAIVAGYARGKGDGISALAQANGVSPSTIKYHLKKHGALAGSPAASPDDEAESDEDLGIGQETAVRDGLAAMMASPEMQRLIDAAVASKLAQMGAPVQGPAQTEDFKAFTASLAHLIEVNAMQQPGYSKPLSAEEVDRRASGLVEMKALLEQYERAGTPPLYLLQDGFFECTNALEFQPGSQIRTYLPPAESFVPKNPEAERVYAAMMQWIGGPTLGIGEQVEAAMIASKNLAPLVTGALNPMAGKRGLVELVNVPVTDVSRKRMSGTLVPERHDISLAERAAGPQGPVFVGDRAA